MIYLPAGEGAFRAVAAYAMSPEHTEYERSHPTPVIPGTMVGRVVLSGGPVQIEDAAADPTYTWAEGRQIGGFRTILGVPIRKEARLIGTVGLARMEVRLFSREEIELVHTFADQAAIVIDNVRLFTELQEKNRALTVAHAQIIEALEQQTATSEVLKVISRSAFDLEPVLETLVENATRLCGADRGHVYGLDGELLRVGVTSGADPEFKEYLQRNPIRIGPGSVTGRAAFERRTVHVHDVLREPNYELHQRQRVGGYRTVLAVPMLREESLVGVITIWKSEVGPFTDKQIELVTTFADQAVIAIENVRLFKELEVKTQDLTRSVGELRALGDVGRALSSTLDLDTVLQTIVTRASQLAGTDACSVFEYDDVAEVFRLRASHYRDPGEAATLEAIGRATPI